MTLAILLPTRGRPANLERFLEAVNKTADDVSTYIRLDKNDPFIEDYEKVLKNTPGSLVVRYGRRVGFGRSLNELAKQAAADGMEYLGMFGDDVVPSTPHWDTRLIESLKGELGVAYGDDGLRNRHPLDLPTHYIVPTEVYRRLGYLSPPGFRHLYLDNVARDIGRFLGNFQYVPVSIRHLHPWAEGEDIDDATYREGGRNAQIREADRTAYLKWGQDKTWRRKLSS